MSRKRKNIIDVITARKFLYQVYGLKTKEVTSYHLRIVHEEFKGIFDWYHTTGKLLCNTRNGYGEDSYAHLRHCFTDEEAAIAIVRHVQKKLSKNDRYYWDKKPRKDHREALTSFKEKIYGRTKNIQTTSCSDIT